MLEQQRNIFFLFDSLPVFSAMCVLKGFFEKIYVFIPVRADVWKKRQVLAGKTDHRRQCRALGLLSPNPRRPSLGIMTCC